MVFSNFATLLGLQWKESIQEKETQSTYSQCSKWFQAMIISIFM